MKHLHQTGLFLLLLLTAFLLLLGHAWWAAPPEPEPTFDLLAATSLPNLNDADTPVELVNTPEPEMGTEPALLPVSVRLPDPEPALEMPAEPAILMVPRSPAGESTMMRTWKLAGWPALLALMASPVLAQQPAEPDKTSVEILRKLDDLKTAVERLRTESGVLDAMAKQTIEEINKLKSDVALLRRDVDSLKAQPTTRVAMSPSTPTTGKIRLVNTYPEQMTVLVNQAAYRLLPGEIRDVEIPAGQFVYQVLSAQQTPQSRLLAANDTFMITVYPQAR
jgi:hypothetical protein